MGGRQARYIEAHAAQEHTRGGGGGGSPAFLMKFASEESIDGVLIPMGEGLVVWVVGGDRVGQNWFTGWIVGPVVCVGCTGLDPSLQEGGFFLREFFAEVRGWHPDIRVLRQDADHKFRLRGITGYDSDFSGVSRGTRSGLRVEA